MKTRIRTMFAGLTVAVMASSALALSSAAEGNRAVPGAALTVAMAYGGPYNVSFYSTHGAFDAVWAGVYDTGAALAGYDVGWIVTA